MQDKAGEKYWSTYWENATLPEAFNYKSASVNNYPNQVLHKLFSKIFNGEDSKGKSLLEIGCGNSVLLPYFASEFGFQISGLDYSEFGCKQSERILTREGVNGRIILGDALNPDPSLLGKFDVVCSFGVVEHFENTKEVIESFSKFLRPGGLLITSIPNLAGVTGVLQKWLNRPVYDIHVPMSKADLEKHIIDAGLAIVQSGYFLSVSFAVTLEGIDGNRIPNYKLKKIFIKSIRTLSKLTWVIEKLVFRFPSGRLLSAGVMTAARVKK